MARPTSGTRLAEYRRKRSFRQTPEPDGSRASARRARARVFVVQKHAARSLHYDFRLELDGTLKSWAVPKGPSLDPADKRLAVHVEDHPLEYASFEGTIPEGEYGAGPVLLWDHGTWRPDGDPAAAYRAGALKFTLEGAKLRGGWVLARIHGGRKDRDGERSWLLIKQRDGEARPAQSFNVLEARPESVASGRVAAAKTSQTDPVVAGVRLTHADRVLFPRHRTTKLGLARFYEGIAEWILPHLEDRPTALVRCPEGAGGTCFFQKHAGPAAPRTIRRVKIAEKTRVGEYLVVDALPALIGLVQIGILEIHTWNAVAEHLERPNRIVFDLDPGPGVEWPRIADAARLVRTRLQSTGLESFVKTTGGKGLHVVVPLRAGATWDACSAFARRLAEDIAREHPKEFVAQMAKAERKGKIFIDYLRNTRGATTVAAYSTRAVPDAPISVPIAWDELSPQLRSDHYTIANMQRRLADLRADPWAGYWTRRQKLPAKGAAAFPAA
jgi:bifunctional non-homologous end joining protein LigD